MLARFASRVLLALIGHHCRQLETEGLEHRATTVERLGYINDKGMQVRDSHTE